MLYPCMKNSKEKGSGLSPDESLAEYGCFYGYWLHTKYQLQTSQRLFSVRAWKLRRTVTAVRKHPGCILIVWMLMPGGKCMIQSLLCRLYIWKALKRIEISFKWMENNDVILENEMLGRERISLGVSKDGLRELSPKTHHRRRKSSGKQNRCNNFSNWWMVSDDMEFIVS